MNCPACGHDFSIDVPLIAGTPRRVRCPSCAEGLVARKGSDGQVTVHALSTVPDGADDAMAEASGEVGEEGGDGVWADTSRGRKRTVIEGPTHRDAISGQYELVDVDALEEGEDGDADDAPEPAEDAEDPEGRRVGATTGPRIILGGAVKERVDLHRNRTVAMETVREMDAIETPISLPTVDPDAPDDATPPEARSRVTELNLDAVSGEPTASMPAVTPPMAAADAHDVQRPVSGTWRPAADTDLALPSPRAPAREPARSRRFPWAIVVVALLAVVGAGVLLLLASDRGAGAPDKKPGPDAAGPAGQVIASKLFAEGGEGEEEEAAEPFKAAPTQDEEMAAEPHAGAQPPHAKDTRDTKGPPTDPKAAKPEPPPEETKPAPTPPAEPAPEPAPEPAREPAPEPAPEPTPPAKAPNVAGKYEVHGTSADTEAPYLALRSRPTRHSKLRAELPDGTGLDLLRRRGRWWKVRVIGGEDDGLEGYAHARWIRKRRL